MENNLQQFQIAVKKGRILATPEHVKEARALLPSLLSFTKNAVCFVFDEAVLDAVAPVPDLVRLPFPTCWIEMGSPEDDTATCALLRSSGDAPEKIDAVFFAKPGKTIKSGVSVRQWTIGATGELTHDGARVGLQIEDEKYRMDVQGLARTFAAFLSALNCVNVKRIEAKPRPERIAIARSMGRPPIYSTWTLELDISRSRSESAPQGGTHASPRLHLRRGHARQHRPGVWCWVNPHVVGNKDLGMVHKDYAVTASE